jgi:hypothetical protein
MGTSDAIIYLADNRSRIENPTFRSLRTLNQPFHNLITISDETIAPGTVIDYDINCAVLIPLVGDISTGYELSPGQAQLVSGLVSVTNKFEKELVNYLMLSFNDDIKDTYDTAVFDLFSDGNKVLSLFPTIYIGRYDGRKDDIFRIDDRAKGVFVFVIEGVFEVQDRLLHSRDGLALSNIKEVEFEALSNDAIILLIEVGVDL